MQLDKYMQGSQDRRKKRCLSTSQLFGDQCAKPKKHNKTDKVVTHHAGHLVWGDEPNPHNPHAHIGTGAHECMERYRLDSWQQAVMDRLEGLPLGSLKVDLGRPTTKVILDETEKVSAAQEARQAGRRDPQPLDEWWRKASEQEIADTVPKAIEYGATDLLDIGSQLGRFMDRKLTDAEAAELGCWFYLIGKLARATSALERGGWPSNDTIKDAGVYLKMIQRIRSVGGWPGDWLNEEDIAEQW